MELCARDMGWGLAPDHVVLEVGPAGGPAVQALVFPCPPGRWLGSHEGVLGPACEAMRLLPRGELHSSAVVLSLFVLRTLTGQET